VHGDDATRALRAVHAAFALSALGLSIGIVGTGRVGSALIQSLLEQATILEKRFQIKISIRGIINSRSMILGEDVSDIVSAKLNTNKLKAGGGAAAAPASSTGATAAELSPRSGMPRNFSFTGLNTALDSIQEELIAAAAAGAENSNNNRDSVGERSCASDDRDFIADLSGARSDSNDSQPSSSPRSNGSGGVPRSHSNTSLHDIAVTMKQSDDGQNEADLEAFFQHIRAGPTPHCIIIDATTSLETALLHPMWLEKGAHVVTANKNAICSDLELYNKVYEAAGSSGRMYVLCSMFSLPFFVCL
jgi:hypothetical protein